ncbi:MAG: CBS domain-containing protein [Xanthomonadales bacterium]|nr:CBS domain-containing protein [Xanthomonadales bacterium]
MPVEKCSTKQFLDQKGRVVFHIGPDAQVLEALEIMADKDIGVLVVLDDRNRLVGMFSERDYARKIILKKKTSRSTPVSEVMTSKVVTVTEEHSLDDCLAIMTKHNIRHLPVTHGGTVVGVLGIGELVRQKLREKDHEIETLEQYISGGVAYG